MHITHGPFQIIQLTVTVLCISDKKPMPGEKQILQKKKPAQKRKYVEDSDRSMESTPVKLKSTSVAHKVSSSNTTLVKSKTTSVASRLSCCTLIGTSLKWS